jgi:nitrate reductase gamma subunit
MKTFLFALVGLILALISKLVGRFVATVRKVDPQGARWTISEHLWLIGRFFSSAAAVAAIVLAVFLAPPSWATWTVIVGMIALVVGNVSLGALAGTAESLGTFLGRARRWAEIERLIRMKERTRQAFQRFLVVIVGLSLVAGTVPAWTGTACAIVPDETASVSESSLQAAITFIKNTFFEYVASMNCTSVVVVRLGPEPRFAKRTWLGPIPYRPGVDCQRAEAMPLPSEASLFGWSQNVETGLKEGAVARCERRMKASAREDSIARSNLLRQLDAALSFPQIVETSHITEMVRYLTKDDTFGSVVVLSDLRDNPAAPVSRVEVPSDASVVLIALEPDPKYGMIKDVTARIRFWEQNSNVSVLTVDELRPGLWSELAPKR